MSLRLLCPARQLPITNSTYTNQCFYFYNISRSGISVSWLCSFNCANENICIGTQQEYLKYPHKKKNTPLENCFCIPFFAYWAWWTRHDMIGSCSYR